MSPEQFGNYTLLRPLGKGGMAEVFLARATSIGGFQKLVAIKRLLPPYNIDRQIINMLADEARLSVWLTHPNVVQVLDFGRVSRTYYIAMEYVEGCDLCDLVRPKGRSPGRPLPLPTALYAMFQVAEALDYAHRRCNSQGEHLGIIHRDVSPHNVLISGEGQVKLADFGLARASISVHHSHDGVIRGKFSYMPKEQAHGRKIDHRIDLFGAGVTLYEALTGVKPYTSTSLPQQLYQLEQPVPPPSAHVSDIPPEIDDIAMRAMAPDPEDRYQSAAELSSDLRDTMLNLSSMGQEERQLTALVDAARRSPAVHHDPLPHMSIADIPIAADNLIGDELRVVRQTRGGAMERQPQEPAASDGGETRQLPAAGAAGPQADSLEGLQTVAFEGQEAASSLPPAALDGGRPATPDVPSDESAQGAAASRARRPSTEQPSEDDDDLEGPTMETPGAMASSVVVSSPELAEPNGHDTLLDEAQTVQRSPEEALAAFQRALHERKQAKQAAEQPRLAPRHWLALAAAGVLLLMVGFGAGWLVRGPGSGGAGAAIVGGACPDSPPCPECPALGPESAALTPTGAPDAAAAADSASAADTQEAMASSTRPARADRGPRARRKPRRGRRRQFGADRERPPPDRREARGPRSRRPPPPGKGFLAVTATGPAEAYVDDRRSAAPVPIATLALAPGIHRVRVRFTSSGTWSATKWVTIDAGKTTRVHFTEEPGTELPRPEQW